MEPFKRRANSSQMKIAFYNIYEELNRDNLLFRDVNLPIGDNILQPFLRLSQYASSQGVEVGTVDLISINEADAIVFVDMPRKRNSLFLDSIRLDRPIFLLALESPIVKPNSYKVDNHAAFRKVFTWNDDLVNSNPNKYIKINYTYDFPLFQSTDHSDQRKLLCTIAGNKVLNHKLELYSERRRAIEWFEKHLPDQFDLYGHGWDEVATNDTYFHNHILKRMPSIRKLLGSRRVSYRGKVDRKRPTLSKYRFAICYENAMDIPGYITEKIFDCFFAECVPIYYGANNISAHVPKCCFIDKRDFATYADLQDYISTMPESVYVDYLESAKRFLESPRSYQFTNAFFAKSVIDTVLSCI